MRLFRRGKNISHPVYHYSEDGRKTLCGRKITEKWEEVIHIPIFDRGNECITCYLKGEQ